MVCVGIWCIGWWFWFCDWFVCEFDCGVFCEGVVYVVVVLFCFDFVCVGECGVWCVVVYVWLSEVDVCCIGVLFGWWMGCIVFVVIKGC